MRTYLPVRRLGGSLHATADFEAGVMEGTAVTEKIVRYQKYLDKCMSDDKVNEKHVRVSVNITDIKAKSSKKPVNECRVDGS